MKVPGPPEYLRDGLVRVHLAAARRACADYREAAQARVDAEWREWSGDPRAFRYEIGGTTLRLEDAAAVLSAAGLRGRHLEQQLFGNRVRP